MSKSRENKNHPIPSIIMPSDNPSHPPAGSRMSLDSTIYNPTLFIDKKDRKELVWFYVCGRWYSAIKIKQPLWYIDYAVHHNHPDRRHIKKWIDDGKEEADIIIIVQRRTNPGKNYGWYHPVTRMTYLSLQKDYNQFLYYRVSDTHRVVPVKNRLKCFYCKKRCYHQCQVKECGKYCCLYNALCLQKHWRAVVDEYDYFIHDSLPGVQSKEPVSLKITRYYTYDYDNSL